MMVTSPAIDPTEANLTNDGFFPDIDIAALRAENRIDGTVPTMRLRAYLINAVISVNRQLAAFKAKHIAAGTNVLSDIDAPVIDSKNTLTHLYLKAVGCLVKAELIENYRDFDTTTPGRETADELTPNIDELRRSVFWAISDILERPRSNVELI